MSILILGLKADFGFIVGACFLGLGIGLGVGLGEDGVEDIFSTCCLGIFS